MPKQHSRDSIQHFWNFLVAFNGRFGREDYWLGHACQWTILLLASALSGPMQNATTEGERLISIVLIFGLVILSLVSWVATHVKRWHDLGRTGWNQLIVLVPFGPLYIFWKCGCVRGQRGPNIYGDDPLQAVSRDYSEVEQS